MRKHAEIALDLAVQTFTDRVEGDLSPEQLMELDDAQWEARVTPGELFAGWPADRLREAIRRLAVAHERVMDLVAPPGMAGLYEPHYHRQHDNKTGPVDFDAEDGSTVVTITAYPSPVDEDLDIVEIDAQLASPLKIIVNDGDLATIDPTGAATHHL